MPSGNSARAGRFADQAHALLGLPTGPRAAGERSDGPWRLMFVCTGNICRSPYAEQMLATLIRESPLIGQVAPRSAGTDALVGHSMDPAAAAIYAKELGLEPLRHRARQLTATLVTHNDLLLTMESAQRRAVLHSYAKAFPRTFLLTEYVAICRTLVRKNNPPPDTSESSATASLSALTTRAARHRALGAHAPDIADPYHQNMEFHERVANQIREQLEELMSIFITAMGLAQ